MLCKVDIINNTFEAFTIYKYFVKHRYI